jgi:hypothetical protein
MPRFGLLAFCAVAWSTLSARPATAQDATLSIRNDAKLSELVVELGPLDIPAPPGTILQPRIQGSEIPVSGYLKAISVELTDHDGEALPSSLLHHINIIAPQRRELFSPIMQRVGAAGAETGPITLPGFLGYPLQRGDSLVFSVMLHNPTNQSYEHVHMRVRMKYAAGGLLSPLFAIQPFYMDVMPPAGYHVFPLAPGKSSRSWEGSPAVPGRVLALGGHVHRYGTLLTFEDVTKGKVLWQAKPHVDSTGNVTGVPRKFYVSRLGLQLYPSHVYRLTVHYDNPTGETIDAGAMGTLGGVFVPDDRATWPAVDRLHPLYLTDVQVTYARNSGDRSTPHQGHHH